MKKWFMVALLFTSFTLPAVHEASAQVDTYMYIDGVPGEATAKGYENWIVLNSFGHTLTPGRRGAHCEGVALKPLDKASPALWSAVASGTVYPEVKVAIVKTGESAFEFFEARLMNASLSSIKFGGDGTPQEVVVLVPQSLVITYTPETPKGSGTPTTNTVYCGR